MRRLAAEQADLDRAERQRRRQLEGAYVGTVQRTGPTFVTVDALGDRLIGPTRGESASVGARVLVMFAEGDVGDAWIVAA